MKSMKKFASILLALVMAMALTVPAFAEEETTYSIKIQNANAGHTYEAYQIFTGTVSDDGAGMTLSNMKWGANISETVREALGTALGAQSASDLTELGIAEATALRAAEAMAKKSGAEVADIVNEYISGTPVATASAPTDGEYVLNVVPGYYLIKDKDGETTSTDDTITAFILQITGQDEEVTPKNSKIPTPTKEVEDTNDSTGNPATGFGSSADRDVGDEINYKLTATLPDGYTNYKHYKLEFVDTMDPGLTYKEDPAAVVSGTNAEYTLTWENNVLTVSFADLTSDTTLTDGSVITITYVATLNENAVFKNENHLELKYSNDPNWEGDGTTEPPTDTTPKVTAVVFTYNPVVNKTNENNQPLTGAQFTLTKYNPDDPDADEDGWVAVAQKSINDDGTTFTFNGIDDGVYKLVESETPNGYNKVEDIIFAVVADHDDENSTPTVHKATRTDGTWAIGEETLTSFDFTVSATIGEITTTVQNLPGAVMPETGGIGTTIFYTLGGLLVVGAGIILVTKRRMQAQA